MKKLLVVALLGLTSVSALADGHYHHHGGHYGGGSSWNWVAPAIVGGVIGYSISRPPVVVQQPSVVYVPAAPAYPPGYQVPPYGYHWETVLDAGCNCYRSVIAPN